MATRSYDSTLRLRKQAELKERIAAATARLHAARGASSTTYADIAEEAKVSLPTVYAHYPTLDDLLVGCTQHVASQAPPLPVDEILAAPDLDSAMQRLADACEAQHLHFEPWLAWREDRVIPFLTDMSARVREQRAGLVAQVLKRHVGTGAHRDVVAGWESALSFDFWHRLTRGHGLARTAARRVILECLRALAAPQAAPQPKRSPRRK